MALPVEELAAWKAQLVGLLKHGNSYVVNSVVKLLVTLPIEQLAACKEQLSELLTNERSNVVKSVVKLLVTLPIKKLALCKEQLIELLTATDTSEKQLRRLLMLFKLYENMGGVVGSYADMMLVDVLDNGNTMTNQVADLQRLCESMPKVLQAWQAHADLKAKIEGLVEIVPLLQLLSNKGLRKQNWAAVEQLVEIKSDTIEDTFTVGHLLDLKDVNLEVVVFAVAECKTNVIRDMQEFRQNVKQFRADYEKNGPGVKGLQTLEATERLEQYEQEFSEMDRKYILYNAGEAIFGIPTDLDAMYKTRKELKLMRQLYGLRENVDHAASLYGNNMWVDMLEDVDTMTNQVEEFQGLCKAMPKALKSWQAYFDLKVEIEGLIKIVALLQSATGDKVRI